MPRWLAIALTVLALAARPAAAGVVVDLRGDDIMPIRDLPAETAARLGYDGMYQLGYHYHHVSVAMLDMWRSGGEVVVYSGRSYYVLTAADLDVVGDADVPLRYYVPPGLLVVIGLIELGIITSTRRKAWLTIGIGAGLLGVGAVFYAKGLEVEAIVPMLLGLHHIGGTIASLRAQARADTPAPTAPRPKVERHAAAMPSPPLVESDPFRSPPRPPAIVAVQTATPPTTPVAHDPDADKPKLLG
jgi:hypothetical protein